MQKIPFSPDALYFDTRVRSYLEHKLAQAMPEPTSTEFEGFVKNLQLNEPEIFSEVKRILWSSSAHYSADHKSTRNKQLLFRSLQRVDGAIKAKRHLIAYLFGGLAFLIPVLYLFSQALYLNKPTYMNTAIEGDRLGIPLVEASIPEPQVVVHVNQDLPTSEVIAVPVLKVSKQFSELPDAVANPLTIPTKPVSNDSVSASSREAVSETPLVEPTSLPGTITTPALVVSEPPAPVANAAPVEAEQVATPTSTSADVSARPTNLALHTVENASPTTLTIAQGKRPQSLTLIGRDSSP